MELGVHQASSSSYFSALTTKLHLDLGVIISEKAAHLHAVRVSVLKKENNNNNKKPPRVSIGAIKEAMGVLKEKQ